jgi:hypothetical protein
MESRVKLFLVAACALTAACAAPTPQAPAPVAAAQTQPATAGLSVYEGTYALQAPSRVIEVRVWLGADGRLNGEMVGSGQQTTFRPSTTEHRFLHAARDDIWFQFTVENGRATALTMHQGDREISGPLKP